jgi:hypothetical protein
MSMAQLHTSELAELRTKESQLRDQLENVHFALDMLGIPKDPRFLNRKLTPMGRLVTLEDVCPELWQHIKNEMDKYVKANNPQPD